MRGTRLVGGAPRAAGTEDGKRLAAAEERSPAAEEGLGMGPGWAGGSTGLEEGRQGPSLPREADPSRPVEEAPIQGAVLPTGPDPPDPNQGVPMRGDEVPKGREEHPIPGVLVVPSPCAAPGPLDPIRWVAGHRGPTLRAGEVVHTAARRPGGRGWYRGSSSPPRTSGQQ
jgi:hypothetical protein